MKRVLSRFVLFALLAAWAGAAIPVSAQPATAKTPTLEDAVFLDARVDRNDVYLGESLTLILEYWELDFRGLKVQAEMRTSQPALPDTEGFFAGPVTEQRRDATRLGGLYHVTTYTQTLYPARSGSLHIGVWAWKGTVRGYTANGAQALSVDQATQPIEVRVRPLPSPPSTFQGAVGEFELSVEFETRDLTRGVPVALWIDVAGRGNPVTLQAPAIAVEPWFSVGDPQEEGTEAAERGGFRKRFRYALMPLGGGAHTFPPVSMTYFSPAEARYQVCRTAPVPLEIKVTGPEEQLVVIGAGAGGGGPTMTVMEAGRLPLATEVTRFRPRRAHWDFGPLLVLMPPLLFLVILAATRGPAALAWWKQRERSADALAARFAAVESHARPIDALNAVVREILAARTGRDVASLSVPEIRELLGEAADQEAADALASVLRACTGQRYGDEEANPAELISRARAALARVPARRRMGGLP